MCLEPSELFNWFNYRMLYQDIKEMALFVINGLKEKTFFKYLNTELLKTCCHVHMALHDSDVMSRRTHGPVPQVGLWRR